MSKLCFSGVSKRPKFPNIRLIFEGRRRYRAYIVTISLGCPHFEICSPGHTYIHLFKPISNPAQEKTVRLSRFQNRSQNVGQVHPIPILLFVYLAAM